MNMMLLAMALMITMIMVLRMMQTFLAISFLHFDIAVDGPCENARTPAARRAML